jgi:hypothetical protein
MIVEKWTKRSLSYRIIFVDSPEPAPILNLELFKLRGQCPLEFRLQAGLRPAGSSLAALLAARQHIMLRLQSFRHTYMRS